MTTHTLTRRAPSLDGPLRIPPIEANLLPVEIVEKRRGRRVRRIVVSALVVLVVLTMAWYGQASSQTSTAAEAVRVAEEGALRAKRQQGAFADLVKTRAESQAISTRLSGLLATDLQWSRLLYSARLAAPPGVQITGIEASLTDEPAGAAGAVKDPQSDDSAIGTFTVTGTGPTKAAVAAFVDALGEIKGLGNPLLSNATTAEGVLGFTVQLDITAAALGGRYSSKPGPGE